MKTIKKNRNVQNEISQVCKKCKLTSPAKSKKHEEFSQRLPICPGDYINASGLIFPMPVPETKTDFFLEVKADLILVDSKRPPSQLGPLLVFPRDLQYGLCGLN